MQKIIETRNFETVATTRKGLQFKVVGKVNLVDRDWKDDAALPKYGVEVEDKLTVEINGTWYDGIQDHRSNGSFIRIKNCVLMPDAPYVDIAIDITPMQTVVREMYRHELIVGEQKSRNEADAMRKDFEAGTLDEILFN